MILLFILCFYFLVNWLEENTWSRQLHHGGTWLTQVKAFKICLLEIKKKKEGNLISLDLINRIVFVVSVKK